MTRMRIRYAGLAVLATMTFAASPAVAQTQPGAGQSGSFQLAQQTYVSVIGNLETNGYAVVDLETTLLGRIKIVAQNSAHVRELVVSRSTGEIMSDRILRILEESEETTAQARATGSAAANAESGEQSGASLSVDGTISGGVTSDALSGSVGLSAGGEASSSGGGSASGSASGGGSLGGSLGF